MIKSSLSPHRSRLLGVAVLTALVLAVLPVRAAEAQAPADWLAQVNAVRAAAGAPPLVLDPTLSSMAAAHSARMASSAPCPPSQIPVGCLRHDALVPPPGVAWTGLAENVGVGVDMGQIMGGWRNSGQHYANMTNPAYTHLGVGVATATAPNGTVYLYVTHKFMGVAGGAPAPAPPPPPPPPPPPAPPTAPPPPTAPQPTAPPATAPTTTAAPTPTTEAPAEPIGVAPSSETIEDRTVRVAAVLDALDAVPR